jgi:heptosyltransferase-2
MRKIKRTGKERYLLVRTDRIGDVILSTPVIEALKSSCPQSHLTMMVSPYAADVVKNNLHLDDVIIDDHNGRHRGVKGFFKLAAEVKAMRFDVGIVLRPTFRLALLLFLAGVRYRIGTGYRFYQMLFNRRLYEHRKVNLRHEAEYNLSLLRPLNITPERILPRVYLSDEEVKFARQVFDEFGITPEDTVVLIHPGSGDSSLNLPPRKFAQVADRLTEETGAKIILTGTEKEKRLVDLVKGNMQQSAFDLVARTNLRELAAVLSNCDLVISNSTGPMHLSAAVGTPVVAIFCPIFAAGPIRWGPYGEGHEVVLPPVPVCLRCKPDRCPHYDCMEKIRAGQVVSKALAVLKRRESRKGTTTRK